MGIAIGTILWSANGKRWVRQWSTSAHLSDRWLTHIWTTSTSRLDDHNYWLWWLAAWEQWVVRSCFNSFVNQSCLQAKIIVKVVFFSLTQYHYHTWSPKRFVWCSRVLWCQRLREGVLVNEGDIKRQPDWNLIWPLFTTFTPITNNFGWD